MPVTDFQVADKYTYLNGFNTFHESEALPDTLPIGHNSPQRPAHGLYAEKLSGTAFTVPRHENQQVWLYRILPSCAHTTFQPRPRCKQLCQNEYRYVPNQLRWNPFDHATGGADWTEGLHKLAGAGEPAMKTGLVIYTFAVDKSMPARTAFYSADGDFLIVPQTGVLDIQTELGRLLVRPNEVCLIPRGIRYNVQLPNGPIRGYILELYQGHFQLPELGPIGTNGLANLQDFQAPVAAYDHDTDNTYTILAKFVDNLYSATQRHSPFDVVAWRGNYYPCKYDLGRFNAIGTISYDHPDPSIFTVLTAQSDHAGQAIADFVVFPPRWLVGEDTFRPPYFHRNCMSEFMGMISGEYDAKASGFCPGGASLHNVMSAHGPDADSYQRASEAELGPQKIGQGSMAFMFESCLMLGVTEWGLKTSQKSQKEYNEQSWIGLQSRFTKPE